MKLSAFLTILASAVVSAELGGVLICQGVNATGDCHYQVYETNGTCYDLPHNLYQNASTFAPDGEDFFCYPHTGKCSDPCFSPEGCTVGGINFTTSWKYDLGTVGWANLIGNIDCGQGSDFFTTGPPKA